MTRRCVILDTNQWISHLMLRSPTSAAVLYSLRQQNGVLGVPYVVEEELKRCALEEGRRARERVEAGLDVLRRLLGSAPSPTLARDEELAEATNRRFTELDSFLVRVPFSCAQAESALRRVIDKVPPNREGNQQYKDTLIWEAVLEVATNQDVLFVTADKGFYAGRDASKGLAPELLVDLEAVEGTVTVMDSLAGAAEQLRVTEPPVDVEALLLLVGSAVVDRVTQPAKLVDFTVGAMTDHDLHVYATEAPEVVAVTFTVTHALHDLREPRRSMAEAEVEGDCTIRAGQLGDIRPNTVVLRWREATGRAERIRESYAYGDPAYVGERHLPYTERTEITLPGPDPSGFR